MDKIEGDAVFSQTIFNLMPDSFYTDGEKMDF